MTSCFTTALWSDRDDCYSLSRYSTHEDEGMSFFEKLALTPFTLVLDVLTMPIQSLFTGDDDDPFSSASRHHEHSNPPPAPSSSRPTPRTDGHAATRAIGGETPVLHPRRE